MHEAATVCNGFVEAIGNTPLIRLREASESTGCEILGKAEFANPGGSIKDRAAWWMIREAEKNGSLQAGPSSRAPPAIPVSALPIFATRAATTA